MNTREVGGSEQMRNHMSSLLFWIAGVHLWLVQSSSESTSDQHWDCRTPWESSKSRTGCTAYTWNTTWCRGNLFFPNFTLEDLSKYIYLLCQGFLLFFLYDSLLSLSLTLVCCSNVQLELKPKQFQLIVNYCHLNNCVIKKCCSICFLVLIIVLTGVEDCTAATRHWIQSVIESWPRKGMFFFYF